MKSKKKQCENREKTNGKKATQSDIQEFDDNDLGGSRREKVKEDNLCYKEWERYKKINE